MPADWPCCGSRQAPCHKAAIRDSGVGLSAEDQRQLFTRFSRARNSATAAIGGTGLGLTITRSLVEMQGGEISVTGVPGLGSTFSFTLPAAAPEPTLDGHYYRDRGQD
ncbi:MAG TPA: ATP-binding protein [Chloroflexota bacterium]|jgi:signal transduction histidine kinase